MGYDLHVTRREDWAGKDSGPAITREEFEREILSDPRFRIDDSLGPDFAVYTAPGIAPDHAPWLWWTDGELLSKNPNREFIRIAHEIALRLNARVFGDDGEEYGRHGKPINS